MYLIYLDESGNSGVNLQDPQQPIFVLCALVVPEDKWLPVEIELQDSIDRFFPQPRPAGFEVHTNELINPRGYFRTFPVQHRLDFLQEWMTIAESNGLKVIYRAIAKKRLAQWIQNTYGAGVNINPHVVAFPLVAQVINSYLKSEPGSPLGILIADENKDVEYDIEKAIRLLRVDKSHLRLSQIIEKGFFVESHKSFFLQLCDLCAFCARRMEEQKAGVPVKALDQTIIPWVTPLIHRGTESMPDVLTWLQDNQVQKKGAARDKVAGPEKVRTTLVAKKKHTKSPLRPQ